MTGVVTTRTHEAYVEIRRRIIELEMPPGSQFSEGELAADLGLSKTPIREALGRMRQEGLVEAVARSGYRVSPVTVKDARDLFALRSILEGEAAALAADRGADLQALRELDRLCKTSYDPKDQSSITAFLRANTIFHVTLATLGGNERLATMLEQVLVQLERLFRLGLSFRSRANEMIHEHTELLSAVKAGDADAARKVAVGQASTSQLMVLEALLESDAVQSTNIAATRN